MDERLSFELLSMQARDRTIRSRMTMASFPGTTVRPEEGRQWEFVDRVNTERLKEIVAQYGWPGKSLVGEEGATAALLILLHADRDIPFQKSCLPLLQRAAASGEIPAKDMALLTDRIRVNEHRPQLYGTQTRYSEGRMLPLQIEDADQVNIRRAAVGLPPLKLPDETMS